MRTKLSVRLTNMWEHHTEFETMEERSAEKITDEDVKEEPEKCKKEEKGKNKKHIDTGAWNMEEKQEKSRIDRQFDFIREIDKEKLLQDRLFYQMQSGVKTMRSMHGIWRS